jgi:DNA-binding response OmpR family regulator
MRVLIVEDKVRLAALLQKAVQREGYATLVVHDGEAALAAISSHQLNAVILDVMIPKLDGFAVLERMRREKIRVPTILLTAKDTNHDIVHGLDLGADDHMSKPFDMAVLLARLRALTRRPLSLLEHQLSVGRLFIRPSTHCVECDGVAIPLTPTEYALMELLMRRAGQVVRKETLAETGWGSDDLNEDKLYVFMRALRTKIKFERQPVLLHTIRGVGYMLKVVTA